jgi:hypothetical protein
MARIGTDPGYFAVEMGGMNGKYTPTPQQIQAFNAIKDGKKRITIRSSTGTGKTTWIAQMIIYWLTIHESCKVIVTSTKMDQLRHQIWAEMHILLDRALPALKNGITVAVESAFRIDNPEGAVALAKVAPKGRSEAQQGWHHENMLIIIDEASGVDDDAIEALEGCCTNPNNVLVMLGNPTRLTGHFYASHHKDRAIWHCLHFSGPDSPLVSKEYLEGLIAKYGEKSNIYRVRGLGEFPLSDADSLILLEWIEAAVDRAADATHTLRIGVDPARSTDGDATGLVARSGRRVLAAEQFWVNDLTPVQGRAKNFRDKVMSAWPELVFEGFYVDTIGLGAGVHDGLVSTGEKSTAVNVALPATKQYRDAGELKPANMRAQLWLATLDFIKDDGGSLRGLIDTPELDVLMGELAGPRYKENNHGEILIEPKAEMKKRGLPSPNLADALCLTFAPTDTQDSWDEYYRSQS